jgi:hypothetical protein
LQGDVPGGGFCAWLRAENAQLWAAMVGHRLCRDMAAGRLPQAAYVR